MQKEAVYLEQLFMVGDEVLLVRLKIVVDDVGLCGEARGDQVEDLAQRMRREEGCVPGLIEELRNRFSVGDELLMRGTRNRKAALESVWLSR